MRHFYFKKNLAGKFIYSASAFFMGGVFSATQAELGWFVPISFLFSAIVFFWLGILFRRLPYVLISGKELVVRERLFHVKRLTLPQAKISVNMSHLKLESPSGDVINIRSSLLSAEDYASIKEDMLRKTGVVA